METGIKIALVGQPNCGKSTIFNSVGGYRTATGNFPGTTVKLAWSQVRLDHQVAQLVDLPGIYSLTSTNPAENAAKKFLLNENPSLIINVLDASLPSRSLELTLELRELGIPMVLCLNMMDGLLHRVGLHGISMLPIVLGYGCSVPACMATRILPSCRNRFLASVLATLVPCSARSTVIFALVAFYLGPMWALAIFCFNALVVIVSGCILARLWPEVSAGMILEVPRYQWPVPRVLARKVWMRLREFIVLS